MNYSWTNYTPGYFNGSYGYYSTPTTSHQNPHNTQQHYHVNYGISTSATYQNPHTTTHVPKDSGRFTSAQSRDSPLLPHQNANCPSTANFHSSSNHGVSFAVTNSNPSSAGGLVSNPGAQGASIATPGASIPSPGAHGASIATPGAQGGASIPSPAAHAGANAASVINASFAPLSCAEANAASVTPGSKSASLGSSNSDPQRYNPFSQELNDFLDVWFFLSRFLGCTNCG